MHRDLKILWAVDFAYKAPCTIQHIQSTDHHIDFAKKQETDYKLKLIELQHIIKKKPEFNKQLNSKQLEFEVKTLIIAAYPDHKQQQPKVEWGCTDIYIH